MIKEHDCVVLTSDLPGEGLLSGDVGTVVHIHRDVSAYEVEFATLTGKTIAVATVLSSQCRPIGHRDINHVREVHAAYWTARRTRSDGPRYVEYPAG